MKKEDLFNKDSICIFTDSSFKKTSTGKSSIGTVAPAYCIYNIDNCIEQGFDIVHNTTSQRGELYAMLLGVNASLKYRNFSHIRIFADNMNAVMSFRQWIFDWVRKNNNGAKVLGEDGRINNQDIIMNIIYTIISNNIYLELYHVKGHVNIRKWEDIKYSKELFIRSNPFVGNNVDNSLIYQLAMGNNMVDEFSTTMLKTYGNAKEYDRSNLKEAITFVYKPFDMNNYIKLVNKDGINYGDTAFE